LRSLPQQTPPGEFLTSESLAQQSGPPVFLVLLSATHMAAPITHFISFEVGNFIDGPRGLFSWVWRGAFISVFRMEMIVYVTMEVIRTMKPWASANENTARKPFRPVVAVGSTAIRRGVIVTVRAVGGRSNADADADLRPCFGSGRCEANPSNSYERKIFQPDHKFSSLSRAVNTGAARRYRELTLKLGAHNTGFLVWPI
jgi:hypothetical protein